MENKRFDLEEITYYKDPFITKRRKKAWKVYIQDVFKKKFSDGNLDNEYQDYNRCIYPMKVQTFILNQELLFNRAFKHMILK
jgi:hypothetical protein